MSDDFDNNGYGGFDYDGDGKVGAHEQDFDDDDIKYNQNHPYRGKKSKWKKADEEILATLKQMSKSGRIQLLIYVVVYCVLAIFAGVTGEMEGFVYWLFAIIPYSFICFLISGFIVEPIIAKAQKRKELEDRQHDDGRE